MFCKNELLYDPGPSVLFLGQTFDAGVLLGVGCVQEVVVELEVELDRGYCFEHSVLRWHQPDQNIFGMRVYFSHHRNLMIPPINTILVDTYSVNPEVRTV